MPITSFLNGLRFDPETRRVLGIASKWCASPCALGTAKTASSRPSPPTSVEHAKAGERNPDLLCEPVLEEIRRQQKGSGAMAGHSTP